MSYSVTLDFRVLYKFTTQLLKSIFLILWINISFKLHTQANQTLYAYYLAIKKTNILFCLQKILNKSKKKTVKTLVTNTFFLFLVSIKYYIKHSDCPQQWLCTLSGLSVNVSVFIK